MGQKAPDDCVIPLCDAPTNIHGMPPDLMDKRPWEGNYGSQRDLLEKTLATFMELCAD